MIKYKTKFYQGVVFLLDFKKDLKKEKAELNVKSLLNYLIVGFFTSLLYSFCIYLFSANFDLPLPDFHIVYTSLPFISFSILSLDIILSLKEKGHKLTQLLVFREQNIALILITGLFTPTMFTISYFWLPHATILDFLSIYFVTLGFSFILFLLLGIVIYGMLESTDPVDNVYKITSDKVESNKQFNSELDEARLTKNNFVEHESPTFNHHLTHSAFEDELNELACVVSNILARNYTFNYEELHSVKRSFELLNKSLKHYDSLSVFKQKEANFYLLNIIESIKDEVNSISTKIDHDNLTDIQKIHMMVTNN